MGLSPFRSSHFGVRTREKVSLPNPDPENFRIERLEQAGRFLGALIMYPDATNFEGNKILVFDGVTADELQERAYLDPHFSEDGDVIARFKPDEAGWEDTLLFMQMKHLFARQSSS